jgi:uncharacterized protein (TIGR04255 family)
MTAPLPKRLGIVPIIEAVAEIRFEEGKPGGGQLLAGLLYGNLQEQYPEVRRLPISEVPMQVRQLDAGLRYSPTQVLAGPTGRVMIGDRVLVVSAAAPYPGWSGFRETVLRVWGFAARNPLVGLVERCSIKYVNLIEQPLGTDHLALTTLSIRAMGRQLSGEPTQLRTEDSDGEVTRVLQVVSQASAQSPTEVKHGLAIDLDVIHRGPIRDFWERHGALLESLHEIEKRAFFDTLAPDTLARLQPEY